MKHFSAKAFFSKTAQILALCLLWLGLSSFGGMEDIFEVGSGNGQPSGAGQSAGIDFTVSNKSNSGANYQINVKNQSGKEINAWSLTVPVANEKYGNGNLPQVWNCMVYFSNGNLVFNSDSVSGTVKNAATNTSAGFWAASDSLNFDKAYFNMVFGDGTSYSAYCNAQNANAGGTTGNSTNTSTQKPAAQTVFVDFTPSNYNDAGQNYQVNIANTGSKTVSSWYIYLPVINQKYNSGNLPSFWNCSASYKDGYVVLTSSNYSGTVKGGEKNSQAGMWVLHKGLDFEKATFIANFADGTNYKGNCSGLTASSAGSTGSTGSTNTNNSTTNNGVNAAMQIGASNSTEWGQNYQISIKNQSGKNIRSWVLNVPVLNGKYNAGTLPSYWNCSASFSNNMVVLKSDGNSGSIKNGVTYSEAGIWALHNALDFSKAYYQFTFGDGSTFTGNINGFSDISGVAGGSNSAGSTGTNTGAGTQTVPVITEGSVLNHGKLKVKGTQIVDKNGHTFFMRGVSTHGINWDCGAPFVNKDAFRELSDNWGVNAVRLAMYTAEYNGYCSGGNKAELKALVEKGVNAATELGMYVIIDWHILSDSNPNTNKESAKEFFAYMAQKYANYDNVLYEICNEPNGNTTWKEIKAYAEEIIPVIRQYSKDAIIIVGTPNWCQDVDVASKNPVKGYENIMYSVHFYAATHKNSFRKKVKTALSAGLPILCTEYGLSPASGDGQLDLDSAKTWLDMFDANGISYFCWSFGNKGESSALLKSGTKNWQSKDRSEAGNWIVQQYIQRNK